MAIQLILIIILAIFLFFIATHLYKKLYIKIINNEKPQMKLLEFRTFYKYSIVVLIMIIILIFIFYPSIYKRSIISNSITPGKTVTLVSKTLYYQDHPDKEGFYLTFQVTNEGHQDIYGEFIEVKLYDKSDSFIYRSMVLGHEYLITIFYRGEYDSYLEASQNTTIYLEDALAESGNYCRDFESYVKCGLDLYHD